MMESAEISLESTKKLHKNTIKFLHDLQNEVPDHLAVLKSYYAMRFRVYQHQTKINVVETTNKSYGRCPRCCLKFPETKASYVIKPESKKRKFFKKVSRKKSTNKRLTRFQSKYLKKATPGLGNQLVITCNFCKKEVVHGLQKPAKWRTDLASSQGNKKRPRPKKKKKDPYCGLQKSAVASAQSQHDPVRNKLIHKTIDNKILERKAARMRKKNVSKLSKTLKQRTNVKQNSLSQFLQSFNK